MASHLAMFVLCWIVFAPARKPYPGFANFIDEWSQCDFCFTNFGVILEYLESIIMTKKPFSDFLACGAGMNTLS